MGNRHQDGIHLGWCSMGRDMIRIAEIYAMKNRGKYDDIPPVPLLLSRVGANAPTLTAFKDNISQFTFDATNDEVFGASEVTHRYKEGTNIECHIHWATNGVDVAAKYVKWQLEYSISNAMGEFTTGVPLAVNIEIPANTADRKHMITTLGHIDGTGIKIGAYICWKFNRIAATGDAPTANPFALAVGFHMEQDSFGSVGVYTK